MKYVVTLNGKKYEVEVEKGEAAASAERLDERGGDADSRNRRGIW